jgi:hypothetical protein
MKLSASVGIGILSLLLGVPAAVYAQDEPKQEEPKPEKRQDEAKPPKPEKTKPESGQQDEMKPPKQDEAKPSRQEQTQEKNESKEQMRTAQQGGTNARPAGKGGHIPDDKFRAGFGRSHSFTVQRTTVSGGQSGFVYGGYTFVFVDPWPAEWAYTDNCYVDYIDGEYVLIDLLHPGVQIVLTIVL